MIYDIFDLEKKVAIVTGASSGIGKSISLTLAKAGASVILVSRRIDILNQIVEYINQGGYKSFAIKADISKKDEVDGMLSKALRKFEKIDILVNNAGINREAPIEIFSEKDWDDVINTNLKGAFLCSQAIGRTMIKNRKGKIINITSINSVIAEENIPAYNASKGGLTQLTKSLALDWAKYNINVNAIGPGNFKTEMTKYQYEDEVKNKQIMDSIPLNRWGIPNNDLSGIVILLASEASNYMTGQTIYVDGGCLLQ
jgi:NAD(P)-dependent dehydrogenase (short-subunit alcohol dehydrogenase family)